MPSHPEAPSTLPPEPASSRSRQKSATTRQRTKDGATRPRRPRRAELEASLHACEERLRATVDDLTDLFCRFDREGKLTLVNGAFCQFFGRSRQEVIGTPWQSLVAAADLPQMTAALQTLSLQNPVVICVCQFEAAHGLERRLRFVHRAFFDAAGQIVEGQAVGRDVTGREESDKQREDLVRQRQLALDAARLGGWHYDPRSGMASWDGRCQEIFGLSGPERHKSEILAQVHPEDLPHVQAAMDAALNPAGPGPFVAEYRLMRPHGNQLWVEAHGLAEFEGMGEDRHAVSFAGTVQDITGRKQAEAELRRWADAFEHCAYGVALGLPAVNRLLACNPAYARMLGRTMADLVGRPILDQYAPEERERVRGNISEADRAGQSRLETRMIRADGSTFPVQLDLVSVRGDNGQQPLYRVATVQDITQRRQAEAAIREQSHLQDQLAKITAAVPGIVYSFRMRPDGSTCMPFATPTIEDLWGLRLEEIRHDFAEGFARIHADDSARVRESIVESARTLRPWRGVFRIRHPRKGERWVEGHSVPRREEDDSILWHGFMHDVTERKQVDEELREREERLRMLGDNISGGAIYQLLWHPDGRSRYTYLSAGVERIFGVSMSEVLSDPQPFWGWIADEDRGRLQAAEAISARDLTPFDCEFRQRTVSGEVKWLHACSTPRRAADGSTIWDGVVLDITERKRIEEERELMVRLLRLFNQASDLRELLREVTGLLHGWFGFEAVGVRLRENEDYPYFETRGFPAEFVQLENHLCQRDANGQLVRGLDGQPVLECMCGNVLCQRFDPAQPFFTERGSFWANDTTRLLATSTPADRLAYTRNRCNGEGYESVALFALRIGDTTYGLLQVNDHRKNRFTANSIASLERVADSLAVAIAYRQSAQQLGESEQQFRVMFEVASIGMAQADVRTGRWLRVNPKLCEITGYSEEELLQMGVPDITHPEDRDQDWLLFQQVVRGEVPDYRMEKRYLRKGGQVAWVNVNMTVVRDATGQAVRTMATIEDITERKRADEALRTREYELRSVLNTNPNIIFVKDRESKILLANDALARFYSTTVDQLVGTLQTDLHVRLGMPPGEIAGWLVEDLAAIDTGTTQIVEERSTWQDGSVRWYHTTKARIDLPGGKSGVLVISQDITARKCAERALADEAARRRILVDQSSDGIVVIDEQGAVCEANRRYAEMLGYTPEEVLRLHVWDWDHQWDRAQLLQMIQDVGETGSRFETRHRRKDGSSYDVEISNNGAIIAGRKLVFCVCRDISQRKRAEAQLRKLSRAVEQSPASIVITDPQGRIEYVNPKFVAITGYSFEEARGQNPRVLKSGDLPAAVYAELWRTITAGGEWRGEFHNRRKDGSLFWESAVISAIKDDTGKVTHFLAVKEDITARKLAEDQFWQMSERLQLATGAANIGIWDWDLIHDRLVWDEAMYRLYGITPDQFGGAYEAWQAGLHPEDRDRAKVQVQSALRGDDDFDTEFRVVWPDGSIHHLKANGQVQRDEAGRPVRMLGTNWDITARKDAEQALRRSETLLREMGRLSKAGGWELDVVTGGGQWTEEIARIHDLDLDTQPTRELSTAFYQGDSRAQLDAAVEQAITHGIPYDLELEFVSAKGNRKWVHTIGQPVSNGGRVVKLRGTLQDITERKQAEAALRTSQELYHSLVEQLGHPLFRLDRDGRITFANSRYCKAMDRPLEELVGKSDFDLFPADRAAKYWADSRRVMETGQAFESLERHPGPDGRDSYVRVAKTPLHDSKGQVVGLQCLSWDVTSQHLALRALRESEQRFLAAFQSSPAPAVITSAATQQIREVNAAFCTLTGFSRAELLGETCLGCNLWANPVERAEMMRRYETEGRVRGLEIASRTRAGEVRTLLYSVEPLHLDSEPCLIASGVDITERKQAEEALRQLNQELEQRVTSRTRELARSERRHRDLVETIPDWVWEVDAQSRYVFCGPQSRALLGFEPEEILGRTPFDLMPDGEAQRVANTAAPLMARGQALDALENVIRRKDGELVVLETRGVPVYDADGHVQGYRGVDRDITERRRVAEELRQAKERADAANRAKSVFLANMSHEIRTPMNAVLGFAQLLLSDPTTTPDQRQSLARIMRSGEHLLDIINEILEMARIESGQSVLNPVPCELPNLLRDLEAMFTLRAQSQRIAFAVEAEQDLPRTVVGDATKLRQILINLLSNAFKFTATGGRISLHLKSEPDGPGQVRLTANVADTGIGLQPAEAACVFEPFFQTASGRAAGGTGLGLSISREIALMMGGDLTVRSEAGVGSRFELTVVLPLAGAERCPDGSLRPKVLRLTDGFGGYRVLVVDDSQENADVLARLLTPLHFQVQVASNGLEAVALSQDWAPGLIILDLRMPVMDGFEASRRIRSQDGTARKILILSASVSHETHQQALAAGADAFLRKPFQHEELLECIRSLTGVDYVQSEPPQPSPLPLAGDLDWHARESVSAIPAEWLLKARKALVAADYYELLDLTNQVASRDDPLGRRLRALVEQLDYATLDKLLNPPGSPPWESDRLTSPQT